MTQHLCNDLHALLGVVFHCERTPHETGDHTAIHGRVTWPQHENTGARWVIRRPGGFLWHRVQTSKTTACGVGINDLTLTTLRGRTLARPPADGHVCPACLSVAPWVVDSSGTLAPAA